MTESTGRDFRVINGDCIQVMSEMAEASVDYSVSSPPFNSLYSYSDDTRDLSNNSTTAEFFTHYGYVVDQLARVMKPGRLVSQHVMTLPTSKGRDGHIGLYDFGGDVIRAFESRGFWFHSKVTIWKCPVVAMTRTKAIGLLWKQLRKDSSISRQGIPDEVLTFRRSGDNLQPVTHTKEDFPVSQWQKWASPVWDDIDQSDVLPCRASKEEGDQKHLCPLQLEVIRRCVRLWSNPGDLVLSPFTGIGSEGYVALQEGRRFVGAELKQSYYNQAVANLTAVEQQPRSLFG